MATFSEHISSLDLSKPVVIRGLVTEMPDWKQLVPLRDNPPPWAVAYPEGTFCAVYFDGIEFEKHLDQLNGLRFVWNELDSIRDETFGVSMYMFISESNEGDALTGVTRHADHSNMFHLNCVGRSSWQLWDTRKGHGENYEFVLEPGDILFMPSGVDHEVKSLTRQRAAVVFGDFMPSA